MELFGAADELPSFSSFANEIAHSFAQAREIARLHVPLGSFAEIAWQHDVNLLTARIKLPRTARAAAFGVGFCYHA
jgi:hypothetical protein